MVDCPIVQTLSGSDRSTVRIQFNFPFSNWKIWMLYTALWLVLTWDVVDGDGKDQEENTPPAASCLHNHLLLFTFCFLSAWVACVVASPPLVDISVLHFICTTEEGDIEGKLTQTAHWVTCQETIR